MAEKESISVVDDQYGSPTYAADLAGAIMQIIAKDNFVPGVYHYCNNGIINWHQFATAIKEFTQSNCLVNAISTAGYQHLQKAYYSSLETQKFRHTFNIIIPDWKESLKNVWLF